MTMDQHGVLLLAYGTPDSPDELPEYLLDVRRGRPYTEELLEELSERYAAIGGISPLTRITDEQAQAVAAALAARGRAMPVIVGMRHWRPRIATALEELREAGCRELTALILAPHRCFLTFNLYRDATVQALAEMGWQPPITWVPSWSRQPALIAEQAKALGESLREVPAGQRMRVIFSAHSLPEGRMPEGDPYADDLRANAAAIVAELGQELDWEFAFQSAGASGGSWLGPDINERLPELAGDGITWLVSMPIGFVSDHLEVLYDLDIESRDLATELGMGFSRVPMMNTRDGFVAAIADAIIGAHPAP